MMSENYKNGGAAVALLEALPGANQVAVFYMVSLMAWLGIVIGRTETGLFEFRWSATPGRSTVFRHTWSFDRVHDVFALWLREELQRVNGARS